MPDSQGASIMHIRKWLRVLIDRSLLLGTIDRPSVHDLVLDFAVAQHSAQQLREKHRNVVEAFRAARPANMYGRRRFDLSDGHSPVTSYVITEGAHHVASCCQWQSEPLDEPTTTRWLSDVPQDAIVRFVGQAVGREKLTGWATAAERDGQWWMAGRMWAVNRAVTFMQEGHGDTTRALAGKALDAFARMTSANSAGGGSEYTTAVLDDRDEIELFESQALASLCHPDDVGRVPGYERVAGTTAASWHPTMTCTLQFGPGLRHFGLAEGRASVVGMGETYAAFCGTAKTFARTSPDPAVVERCLVYTNAFPQFFDAQLLAGGGQFDWEERFGANGELLLEAARAYNYDKHHAWLIREGFNADWFSVFVSVPLSMALHYGAMEQTRETFELCLAATRRSMDEVDQANEIWGLILGLPMQAVFASLVLPDQREAVAEMMANYGLTWRTSDETVDKSTITLLRKRGDTTVDAHSASAELISWLAKLAYVLVSSRPDVGAEEVISGLPTVQEITQYAMTFSHSAVVLTFFGPLMNLFLLCALVCERHGRHAEGVRYAQAALNTNFRTAGNCQPTTHCVAHMVCGRLSARLGRTADAVAAFEAAVEQAHQYGLRLLEAFALRDLKTCVADQGEEPARRLGAVLRLLKGPPELLAPLLNGLDTAELMALDPPALPEGVPPERVD